MNGDDDGSELGVGVRVEESGGAGGEVWERGGGGGGWSRSAGFGSGAECGGIAEERGPAGEVVGELGADEEVGGVEGGAGDASALEERGGVGESGEGEVGAGADEGAGFGHEGVLGGEPREVVGGGERLGPIAAGGGLGVSGDEGAQAREFEGVGGVVLEQAGDVRGERHKAIVVLRRGRDGGGRGGVPGRERLLLRGKIASGEWAWSSGIVRK